MAVVSQRINKILARLGVLKPMIVNFAKCAAVLTLLMGGGIKVFAQEDSAIDRTDNPTGDRTGTRPAPPEAVAYLGGAVLYSSEYLGSAEEEFRVLPNLSVYDFKGFDFAALALSYDAIDIGGGQGFGQWTFRAGPRAGFQFGRDSDESPTLDGLEDIDSSLVTGGFARVSYGPVGIRINAGQDIIGGHGGFVADLSVGTQLPLGKLFLQPSVSINWADANHNQTVFGITQAQTSTLSEFTIGSGVYGYSANAVGWIDIGEHWQASASLSYRWFVNDARNSPVITAIDGSRNGIFSTIGFTRKFDLSNY